MYKFMLIILSLVVILFSSSCAPYPVVAKTSGLPLGTVITLGGKKMIVVSQENEKVRLKPYKSAVVKTVELKPEAPKPEWESKKVVTEGVKNVQECLNPMGCPQDVKTGECLEGCSEQKVKIKMTETIVTSETKVDEVKPVSDTLDSELVLATLFRIDTVYGELYTDYRQYYGKPEWLCVLANTMGDKRTKRAISQLIYSNPKFLKICDNTFIHSKGTNLWTAYRP
jgi:hypothetical protein